MFDNVTALIADDDPINLMLVEAILAELDMKLLTAGNGQEALTLLAENPGVDVLLLDLEMPVMSGIEALSQIKQNPHINHIPVIVVSADRNEVNRTLKMGANDFVAKPYNPDELRLRVMNHIRGKRNQDIVNDLNLMLEREVAKKTAALQSALDLTLETELEICLRLGRAAEFRDLDTGMHIRRISEMSKALALLAGLTEDEAELLRFASPLHDVGKIGIPDRILLKPGRLDDNEMQIMKLHTVIGGRILSEGERFPSLEAGQVVALQHHEKWDGSGYPLGLAGDDIHIFARIVMIADVFDALASDRPYKKALSLEKTVEIMQEGRNSFFDPRLLGLFVEHLDAFVEIRDCLMDSESESDPLQQLMQVT